MRRSRVVTVALLALTSVTIIALWTSVSLAEAPDSRQRKPVTQEAILVAGATSATVARVAAGSMWLRPSNEPFAMVVVGTVLLALAAAVRRGV
jgi:hypothetical protein